ncbi:MAG: hypothetical protein K8H86_05595, partial [Ignavibacteriaceae bacterium]|nr:hypothetical protein [Ignavibacteriaceae bacterium]
MLLLLRLLFFHTHGQGVFFPVELQTLLPQTVYGKQQDADKGYNPVKKGAKSYHPLLAFASELKIVVHNRFRTGSAYTSNGILSFVKQIVEI